MIVNNELEYIWVFITSEAPTIESTLCLF